MILRCINPPLRGRFQGGEAESPGPRHSANGGLPTKLTNFLFLAGKWHDFQFIILQIPKAFTVSLYLMTPIAQPGPSAG